MRVLLKCQIGTFARAIMGLVAFRCYYEVPSEFLKIDRQRVTTTERLVHFFVAVQTDVSSDSSFTFFRCYIYVGDLKEKKNFLLTSYRKEKEGYRFWTNEIQKRAIPLEDEFLKKNSFKESHSISEGEYKIKLKKGKNELE